MKNKSILIVALCAALLCIVSCKKDQKGYSGNPVSLGLSVRWAETNAGAGNRGELGTKMTYDEAIQYASESRKWSLPTQDQWVELLGSGKVTVNHNKDPAGFLFVSEEYGDLFLPAGMYLASDLFDGKIAYVDLTGSSPNYLKTANTEETFSVRMVRK